MIDADDHNIFININSRNGASIKQEGMISLDKIDTESFLLLGLFCCLLLFFFKEIHEAELRLLSFQLSLYHLQDNPVIHCSLNVSLLTLHLVLFFLTVLLIFGNQLREI